MPQILKHTLTTLPCFFIFQEEAYQTDIMAALRKWSHIKTRIITKIFPKADPLHQTLVKINISYSLKYF